ADLDREPHNYRRLPTAHGDVVFAHGRDPYFPGWIDTLQLNYRHAGLRQAVLETLYEVLELCDGLRCDMAMLLLPDVIARTWGERSRPADGSEPVDDSFWPAAIARLRRREGHFIFRAEVYWDLEWTLQQQGFDYTYDKPLYDRLFAGVAGPVRDHLRGSWEFQQRSVRFLENHDEARAASTFPWPVHQAAAVLAYLTPGMRFFYDGQFEGRKQRTNNHLARRAAEDPDPVVADFYTRLLSCLKRPEVSQGVWQLRDCRMAWEGNQSFEQFVAFTWEGEEGELLLVAVNYGSAPGQCRL